MSRDASAAHRDPRTWVVTGLAIASTTTVLGRQPLSWDEAVTLSAARRSPAHLYGLLGHTDAPLGLYYAGMHTWLALTSWLGLPTTEWVARLPSAAGIVASVFALMMLMRPWFGPSTALLAGAVFAVFPLATFYAQDARPYALVTGAFLASTLALRRALEHDAMRWYAIYSVLVTTTLYLHLFAIYAVLTQALLIASRVQLRRWAVALGAALLSAVPLLALAAGQSGEVGWLPAESPLTVLSAVVRIAGSAALVAVAAVVAVTLLVRRAGRLRMNRPMAFLLAWAVAPTAMLIVVGLAVPDLVARYALVSGPAIVGLLAVAIVRVGGSRGRVLAATAFVTALATTITQQAQPYKYEDYRSAADAVADHARTGDVVLFLPASVRLGFDAYPPTGTDDHPVIDIALAPGGAPVHADQIAGIDRPTAAFAAGLRRAVTVFVLSNRPDSLPGFGGIAAVLAGRRLVQQSRYGDVYLMALRRR